MSKLEIIATNEAPAAIGPYSQAVRFGSLLFTSGQIPLGLDGQVVAGGIVEQTHQVFQNLQVILKASACGLNDVIKTTVFIKDMNQFSAFNEVYASYFGDHKPARSTVEVARLPKDVFVEIELVVSVDVG
jgi:2-iminobutanoate/2-iminopropanoate deaminase